MACPRYSGGVQVGKSVGSTLPRRRSGVGFAADFTSFRFKSKRAGSLSSLCAASSTLPTRSRTAPHGVGLPRRNLAPGHAVSDHDMPTLPAVALMKFNVDVAACLMPISAGERGHDRSLRYRSRLI